MSEFTGDSAPSTKQQMLMLEKQIDKQFKQLKLTKTLSPMKTTKEKLNNDRGRNDHQQPQHSIMWLGSVSINEKASKSPITINKTILGKDPYKIH